jgi:hypothetical protein
VGGDGQSLVALITDFDTIFLPCRQAIAFVTFLVGFITVLCIGNYFRAKRAQERQRQRRDAKIASQTYATDRGIGSYEAPSQPDGPGIQA